jgi:uncharacterized membrane protein (DUF2068 family)
MLMLIIGGLDFFQGLVAVIRDQYYVQGVNGALVVDVSEWGWAMMVWGALLFIVGYGLLSGASWARWLAIFGVGVNFLAQLSFDGSASFTLWGATIMALNIVVLYALIVRWDDAKSAVTAQ